MSVLFFIPVGFFAGFLNGFLGTGGGILIVLTSGLICKKIKPKDVFALSLTATLFYSLISAFLYMKNGSFDFSSSLFCILPAIAGGFVGGILLDKLNVSFVKKVFAILCIFAGANMTGIIGRFQ